MQCCSALFLGFSGTSPSVFGTLQSMPSQTPRFKPQTRLVTTPRCLLPATGRALVVCRCPLLLTPTKPDSCTNLARRAAQNQVSAHGAANTD